MSEIQFTKMVASGNDFVVIDAKSSKLKAQSSKLSAFAKEICDRKFGIGADGLLVLEKSRKADFTMRIFNPDGSEPNMCGNGARCAALFYVSNQKPETRNQKKIKFETKAGLIEAEVKKDVVKLKMTDPKDLWANIDLNIGTQFYKVHFINTGVPHTVFFVGNVDTINVKEVGKQIRFHKHFQPEGTNANFAQVKDTRTVKVRTYERGVEDETLACGTGSIAAALLSFYLKLTKKSPVSVETRSEETLKVYFDYAECSYSKKSCFGIPKSNQRSCYIRDKKDKFSNVWLEGSAKIVYEGTYLV